MTDIKIIGAHIDSNYDNIIKEAKRIKNYGGNIIQLFVDPLCKDKKTYLELNKFLKEHNMLCVVHASYTINLASSWNEYSSPIKQFIQEIQVAEIIGAIGIVIHLGKQLELTKEVALNNMYTSLMHVHNATKNLKVKIYLESSTGQGSELCYLIEDFSYFYKKFLNHPREDVKNRFKICIDSCHIFNAGYDLRSKNSIDMYLDTFEELIGIKNIKLIHLNDSKNEIGANVDRHENIGKGYIGEKGLLYFGKYFMNMKIPCILETPDSRSHEKEIKRMLN